MTAPVGHPNVLTAGAEAAPTRPRAFTAGFADQLGERQLAFDSAAGISIEVLHLNKVFADSPEFETALRARVEALSHLQHASLAAVLSVDRDDEQGLSLVSKHTSGRRVSELVEKAHGPAFALELVRLVTPALAALQRAGDGMAHGALSAERIVVTRDGRLVVVEHVLGSAIASLKLGRQELLDLGLALPDGSDPIQFDSRLDMIQLGMVALSLLLGRHLAPADYPAKIPTLFDEFVQTSRSPILAAKMRGWLERAMQLSPRPFAGARDAYEAFSDLPDDVDVRLAGMTMPAVPAEDRRTPELDPAVPARPRALEPQPIVAEPATPRVPVQPTPPAVMQKAPARGLSRIAMGAIAGLGLLAVGEAVVIFALPYTRPAAEVVEIRPAADLTSRTAPAPAPLPAEDPAGSLIGNAAASAPLAVEPPPAALAPAAAPVVAGPRFGGITVSSAIDLQVFKDGKLVGSTAGPLALNEGPHNLEFVNEALGFRLPQAISVRSGQMTSVKIALPNGRLSINAVPWAEVLIDGTLHGETPLANLSLPIGTHEVVFRHPQFGERKQTVVVKVDGLVRLTQTFQQDFKD